MKFANPLWLLLLVPLGLWLFYALRSSFGHRSALPYSDLFLIGKFVKRGIEDEKILEFLKFFGFLFLVIALARPQKFSNTKEPPRPLVDIILCLDTSLSMSALDFDPQNRLEAAKKTAEEFVRRRSGDRIGLVVFGGRAIMQCPLTLDHESLIDFLRTIPMNATGTDGTAIGTAIALASSRLSESEAKTKIIILLTDGRNNTGHIDPLTAASSAGELGIKIYTIGCAIPGGGLVPVEDSVFGKRLVKMAEDLDEPALQEIARLTQARYFRVTGAGKFKEIYDQIDSMEKTNVETETQSSVDDFYLSFLFTSMALLFSALVLKSTVWRTVP